MTSCALLLVTALAVILMGCDEQPRAMVASTPSSAPLEPGALLAKKYACMACHNIESKQVGPAYRDVAARYRNDKDATKKLAQKIRNGGTGVWGPQAMPPNTTVKDEDLTILTAWILAR